MAFYDDDFFYYLKIAINLASGHGSTFDGIHLTNGYHPLWLLLLAALLKVLPVQAVLNAVLILTCISTFATYALTLACFNRVARDSFVASLGAAFIAFTAVRILHSGMEIVLSIPLALSLCYFRIRPGFTWTAKTALLFGLFASLLALSRLDSILLIGLIVMLELVWPENIPRSQRLRIGAWIAVGMLPVAGYAAVNHHLFGIVLPVSGLAKQLRHHHGLNPEPFKTLAVGLSPYLRLLIVAPVALAAGFALVSVALNGWRRLPLHFRPLAFALLLFPLLQSVCLSWLSDWPPFPWYLYSFTLAEVGAGLILFGQDFRLPELAAIGAECAALALLLLVMAVYSAERLRASRHREDILYWMYDAATQIASFARTHPGVYAMGDRAGMPGYLLDDPVIQLEGLVMDEQYLQNIREERNLNQVLRHYGVTYYIASNPERNGACYGVREPIQAGPDSRVMRGTFCQPPIDHSLSNGVVTDIFDLRDGRTMAAQ